MKKIVAVAVLMLAIAICFAACGKNKPAPTPQESLSANMSGVLSDLTSSTVPTSTPQSSDSILPVSSNDEASTMILTTKQGETAPSVATTAFVPDPAAVTSIITTATPSTSPMIPTNYTYTTPTVITSQLTPTSSLNTTADPTSDLVADRSTTTTKPTTTAAPSSSATRKSKSVVINDIATTSDKKMIVTINPNGWDGKFKSNSQTISVKVDGEFKSATCSINSGSSNADGFPYLTIDLSNVSVPEGANVQFTVPSAFLQTASGEQYSSAFSGSYTMM